MTVQAYPTDPKARAASTTSAFQYRVYDALLLIPAGKVTSYKHLACFLETAPRAVGGALKNNRFAPYIPCHRVIASDYFIGGFMAQWGEGQQVNRKLELLKGEGIDFDKDGFLCEAHRKSKMYDFSDQQNKLKKAT